MRKNDSLFVEMSRSQGFPQKMVRKKGPQKKIRSFGEASDVPVYKPRWLHCLLHGFDRSPFSKTHRSPASLGISQSLQILLMAGAQLRKNDGVKNFRCRLFWGQRS